MGCRFSGLLRPLNGVAGWRYSVRSFEGKIEAPVAFLKAVLSGIAGVFYACGRLGLDYRNKVAQRPCIYCVGKAPRCLPSAHPVSVGA